MKEGSIILIISLGVFITACNKEKSEQIQKLEGKDSLIVLINTSDLNRYQVAQLINKINDCNPVIIGLNESLTFRDNFSEDSALSSAIANSAKVVLIEDSENDKFLLPDPIFTINYLGSSSEEFLIDENDVVVGFRPHIQNQNTISPCFSYSLVFAHSPEIGSRFFVKHSEDPIPIIFYRELDGFNFFNIRQVLESDDCSYFSGKIILMGNLGDNQNDTLLTPFDLARKDGKRTHSTVVIANIALNVFKRGELNSD
jgi:CHASE2 domain-containing sensor protein